MLQWLKSDRERKTLKEKERTRERERERERERDIVCVSTTKNEGVKRERAKHRVKTMYDSFPT